MSRCVRVDDELGPQPPARPGVDACCRGGCTPCVFDLYEAALERYRIALTAWRERRAKDETMSEAMSESKNEAIDKKRGGPC